jgi:hypothetical protein
MTGRVATGRINRIWPAMATRLSSPLTMLASLTLFSFSSCWKRLDCDGPPRTRDYLEMQLRAKRGLRQRRSRSAAAKLWMRSSGLEPENVRSSLSTNPVRTRRSRSATPAPGSSRPGQHRRHPILHQAAWRRHGSCDCPHDIEAHRGTISAENQMRGGALFTIKLPIGLRSGTTDDPDAGLRTS